MAGLSRYNGPGDEARQPIRKYPGSANRGSADDSFFT
jgi:hypothetical protein